MITIADICGVVMRAQEKVKRELAEIKDAKTQLERELERKNRQLLSAESEPAAAPAPAAEEAPEEPEEQEEEPEQGGRQKRARSSPKHFEAGPASAQWSSDATQEEADAEAEAEEEEQEDLSKLRVAELKDRLAELGFATDGKKAVLVERLAAALAGEIQPEEEEEEEEQEEEVEMITKETIKSWTVAELKAELEAYNLPTNGVKATLIKRLAKEL